MNRHSRYIRIDKGCMNRRSRYIRLDKGCINEDVNISIVHYVIVLPIAYHSIFTIAVSPSNPETTYI